VEGAATITVPAAVISTTRSVVPLSWSRTGEKAFYKNMLDIAERDAEEHVGTKAAAKYAKEADGYWQKGESLGCGWAA
jgi:hypothetical protein